MTTIALRYDLRSAPFAATKHPELYQACLDQVAWADANGVGDVVVLSEHHAMEDGFIPAPLSERRYVAKVLRAVGGNETATARILGFDRRTLYRKLARYGMEAGAPN